MEYLPQERVGNEFKTGGHGLRVKPDFGLEAGFVDEFLVGQSVLNCLP